MLFFGRCCSGVVVVIVVVVVVVVDAVVVDSAHSSISRRVAGLTVAWSLDRFPKCLL